MVDKRGNSFTTFAQVGKIIIFFKLSLRRHKARKGMRM